VRRALAGDMIGAGSMGALCLALGCKPLDCFVEVSADGEVIEAEAGPSLRSVQSRRARSAPGA